MDSKNTVKDINLKEIKTNKTKITQNTIKYFM